MAWYRIYFMNSENHIARAVALECADDAEAIARLHAQLQPAELWQGARFVERTQVIGQSILSARQLPPLIAGNDKPRAD